MEAMDLALSHSIEASVSHPSACVTLRVSHAHATTTISKAFTTASRPDRATPTEQPRNSDTGRGKDRSVISNRERVIKT